MDYMGKGVIVHLLGFRGLELGTLFIGVGGEDNLIQESEQQSPSIRLLADSLDKEWKLGTSDCKIFKSTGFNGQLP